MKINLSQAGKRFNREWIFRNATLEFEGNTAYAITGPNGSGKSTLLQCLAGMMQLSEGKINYTIGNQPSSNEQAYQQISFCAPYLELIEEMTLLEFFNFHSQFKPFLPGVSVHEIIERLELQAAAKKQMRYYSSGMKQRVRLAQAIFSDTPVLLLDEPCSNFDLQGIALYHSLINDYCEKRLVIVSSNDEVEYRFTKQQFSILDFKKQMV